jgi:hypothetical protein
VSAEQLFSDPFSAHKHISKLATSGSIINHHSQLIFMICTGMTFAVSSKLNKSTNKVDIDMLPYANFLYIIMASKSYNIPILSVGTNVC